MPETESLVSDLQADFLVNVVVFRLLESQNSRKGEIIVKLREREGQRVDLGRSLKNHLWMVDGGWWYTFP